MSPENLMNKTYSSLSDVWSYGVVVFEIITRDEPYSNLDAGQAVAQVITEKATLNLPRGTHPDLQKLQKDCMEYESSARPDFVKIAQRVEKFPLEAFQGL